MTQPLHHLGDAFCPLPVGQFRALEHDNGQSKLARGIDLGTRAGAAGVPRNDPFNSARVHHLQLAGKREWPTRHDDLRIGKRQRPVRRVDKSQRIGVLRFGAERGDVLPADGEKDAGAFDRQCRNGGSDIRYLDPVVARSFGPWLTLEGDELFSGRRTRDNRVAADLGRKRMRRVDHMGDCFPMNVFGKTLRAAEAADADRQLLIGRGASASRVGIDRLKPCARDSVGKRMSLARSAQNEGAYHA